jgi:hypothetical protein
MILDNPYLTTTGDLLIKRVKRLNKTWITVTIGGGIGLFLHYLALTFPFSIGRRKTTPTLILTQGNEGSACLRKSIQGTYIEQ